MQQKQMLLMYTGSASTLTDAQRIDEVRYQLINRNYYLSTGDEPHTLPADGRAAMSLRLRQQLDAFKAGQQTSFQLHARSVSKSDLFLQFQFQFEIIADAGYLVLHYDDERFSEQGMPESAALFDHWLDIITVLYNLYQPVYTYTLPNNGALPPTTDDYLDQRFPMTLYEINLFGPEMVSNMGGVKHLLKTPARLIRQLPDGGILMVPDVPWYYPGRRRRPPSSWPKAARYLKVEVPEFLKSFSSYYEDEDDDE